jgi:amino acid transporter
MAELKQSIGPFALIAVGAAGVIGSSYLYLTSEFFAEFGVGGTIIGMLIATAFAACIALAIAELTSAFPRAGGEVVYNYVAFNRTVGFVVAWMLFVIFVGIIAFYVTAAGFLISKVWPAMNTVPLYTINGGTVYLPVLAVGVGLMILMLLLNWFGASLSFQTQLILFLGMVLLGVAVVVVGFSAGSPGNFWPPFNSASGNPASQSIKFILPALGFLTGFSLVAILAEEAKVSRRRIGIICVTAVSIAGLFYAILFAATGWVIPWKKTASLSNGTIGAFQVAGFPVISWLAFVIAALGVLTTFIAVFASVSRLIFSLARVGIFPPFLAHVDEKSGAPRPALLVTAIVGLGLGWLGPGGLVWLLDTGGVHVAALWIFTAASFYVIRSKYPHLPRPYRVRFSWLPAVGALVGLALVIGSIVPGTGVTLDWPAEYLVIAGLWVLGLIVYVGYVRRSKPADPEGPLRELLGEENYHRLQQGATTPQPPTLAERDKPTSETAPH